MKKLLTAIAMGLVLLGCNKEYDDSDLKNRVTTLETKVGNLEANMKAIQSATNDGVFVQSVEELYQDGKVVGITVTYTNQKVYTFQISGAGSENNISVIRNSDGVLCWAINGEIIKVDGKDLTVGQTPSFSIENGHLIVTIDGQKTDVGPVSGGLGDAIFKDIQITDDAIILVLDDNSTISIPMAKAFRLVIAKTQYAVTTTDPFDIQYTVDNKTASTVVDVFTDSNFSAEVFDDKITITPLVVAKGTALAYADSKVGLTSIVKLTFGPDDEPDTFKNTDDPADPDNNIDYIAEAKDGTVEAHVVSNISFEVKPQVDWIHYVSTKAQSYTITLSLDDNKANEIRTGEVKIVRAGTDQVLQTIVIAQKASEVEYEYYNPAGWDKVFDMSNYKTNSTFKWDGIALNPSSVTLQWKFYSNKWNNHKFNDRDENNNQLFCNRLGEFASADESQSVLLRFSNDGDADGQLCLNAGVLGINQVQISKDNKAYVWPTEEWVVLTIVSDGSKVSIYHNEDLVNSYDATPGASWNFQRFDLSMTWDEGASWPLKQAFNGYSAYARVWSRALGVEDIAATLCDVPSDKTEGLECYWKFDGSTDKYVTNSAPNNSSMELDFTDCWDGNGNATDNSDAAVAAWKALEGADFTGLCSRVKGSGGNSGGGDNPGGGEGGAVNAIDLAKVTNWYLFQEDITLSQGYTYVFHVYVDAFDASGHSYIGKFSDKKPQSAACNNRIRFGETSGKPGEFEWCIDGGPRLKTASELEAGKWYSIALVTDAAGAMSMYVDGVKEAATGTHPGIENAKFGAFEYGDSWGTDGNNPRFFQGALALVSVWDIALDEEAIAALVKKAPANLTDTHLKAYWPMTDGEGGVCKEATGKYEEIDFKYTWSDREGSSSYGTGENLDITGNIVWKEYPAM